MDVEFGYVFAGVGKRPRHPEDERLIKEVSNLVEKASNNGSARLGERLRRGCFT